MLGFRNSICRGLGLAMPKVTTQIVTFSAGIAAVVAGLVPGTAPLNDVLLISGSGVAALGYGLVFLSWMQKRPSGKFKLSRLTNRSVAPSPPKLPETSSSMPRTSSSSIAPPPTPMFETTPPPTPRTPEQPAAPVSTAASSPPSSPSVPAQPEPTQRKPPSLKIPKIPIPGPVIEHKVPIAFVAVGTALVIAALATISPQAGLFAGLFIPGILILGIGSVILFLQLYRRPVGLRRFCMNCGFQMLTTDYICGRCHKQPPSGVDTKSCPNCTAVIPALAKYCKDCGAGQPSIPVLQ